MAPLTRARVLPAPCSAPPRLPGAAGRACALAPARPRPSLSRWAAAPPAAVAREVPRLDERLDDELSRRPLELDPAGYFIIRVDCGARELVAEFYTNVINKDGLACDPLTGEVIPCNKGYVRPASKVYRGRTAKEISVAILETDAGRAPVTHLEHANYLGREFQRAELALVTGDEYVQD